MRSPKPPPSKMTAAKANPETGEVVFPFDGADWRLVFDMPAVAIFEQMTGKSIFSLIGQLKEASDGGPLPMLSTLGQAVLAGLHRHHPDTELGETMRMALDPAVQDALIGGFNAAMPKAPADEKAGGKNPIRARGKKASNRR